MSGTTVVYDSYTSTASRESLSEPRIESASNRENVSKSVSGQFNRDDSKYDVSVSRKMETLASGVSVNGDAPKSCCQKAKGCFGSLFSSKKTKNHES